MSCWCDGEDPGCSACFPRMKEEERIFARARKKAMNPVKLYRAVKALDEMCVCFHDGKIPGEDLFARLLEARDTIRDYEKYVVNPCKT